MKVRVLYEDSLAAGCQPINYAPHRLLLQCLLDLPAIRATFAEFHMLATWVEPHACKGNANIRKTLERNGNAYENSQIAPVICLDSDKVRQLLDIPKSSCKQAVRELFWKPVRFSGKKAFVLLVDNLESILKTAQLQGANFAKEQLESALSKDLSDRDALLRQIANNSELRRKVVAAMPSFDYLIEKTAALVLMD